MNQITSVIVYIGLYNNNHRPCNFNQIKSDICSKVCNFGSANNWAAHNFPIDDPDSNLPIPSKQKKTKYVDSLLVIMVDTATSMHT